MRKLTATGTCGWLLGVQGYPWLVAQQVASLGFILDAYITRRRRAAAPT